jgi:hypothetical protein
VAALWCIHPVAAGASESGASSGSDAIAEDVVLIYGDLNSTVAATLVCSKLLVRVGGGSRVAILRSNHAGRGEPLLVFPIPQFIVDKCIVGLQIGSPEATFTCFVGLACRF